MAYVVNPQAPPGVHQGRFGRATPIDKVTGVAELHAVLDKIGVTLFHPVMLGFSYATRS